MLCGRSLPLTFRLFGLTLTRFFRSLSDSIRLLFLGGDNCLLGVRQSDGQTLNFSISCRAGISQTFVFIQHLLHFFTKITAGGSRNTPRTDRFFIHVFKCLA